MNWDIDDIEWFASRPVVEQVSYTWRKQTRTKWHLHVIFAYSCFLTDLCCKYLSTIKKRERKREETPRPKIKTKSYNNQNSFLVWKIINNYSKKRVFSFFFPLIVCWMSNVLYLICSHSSTTRVHSRVNIPLPHLDVIHSLSFSHSLTEYYTSPVYWNELESCLKIKLSPEIFSLNFILRLPKPSTLSFNLQFYFLKQSYRQLISFYFLIIP